MNESQFILLLLSLDNQELQSMLLSATEIDINTFNIISGIILFRKNVLINIYA